MYPEEFKKVNEDFLKGNRVNDSDLLMLESFYNNLYSQLSMLGKEFQLARLEVFKRWDKITCFISAREES